MTLIIGALVAAFNSHTLKLPIPIPNLYSPHSWLGLLVVILVALQVGVHQSISKSLAAGHVYSVIAAKLERPAAKCPAPKALCLLIAFRLVRFEILSGPCSVAMGVHCLRAQEGRHKGRLRG